MLLESELEGILCNTGLKNKTFSMHYESGKQGALKEALAALCSSVQQAVEEGCEVSAPRKPPFCIALPWGTTWRSLCELLFSCRDVALSAAFWRVSLLLPAGMAAGLHCWPLCDPWC